MTDDYQAYQVLFHDLSDGVGGEPEEFGEGDFDQVDGHGESWNPLVHALIDVELRYIGGDPLGWHNPNYDDRGIPPTDVVDVLDGMMCRGHMTLGDADVLLHDVMPFEYDFMPANVNCP